MISVQVAKDIITGASKNLAPVMKPLLEASGCILAEDIFAAIDIPAYAQSSMDGYAIRFSEKDLPLTIVGEMPAGADRPMVVGDGQAVRIFTGGPLPEGADTILMQEKASVNGNQLLIDDPQLQKGVHVRNKGAEVKAGALAICKGTHLTPAALGFLAGIGVTAVSVYPAPRIAIISTGRELIKPGQELQFGQVYESNSFSLTAALNIAGVSDITVFQADDDLAELSVVLDKSLKDNDVVLLTGGVSVGDYDFVLQAAENCGVEKLFHKVRQKPGKPLFFGRKDAKLIFGLPGNPSSVLSCFYQYVLPSIEAIYGRAGSVKLVQATLTHNYQKAPGLTHFLKAHFSGNQVTPLNAQESFRMSSFAQANAMICLEEERSSYEAGEIVNVYLLPG